MPPRSRALRRPRLTAARRGRSRRAVEGVDEKESEREPSRRPEQHRSQRLERRSSGEPRRGSALGEEQPGLDPPAGDEEDARGRGGGESDEHPGRREQPRGWRDRVDVLVRERDRGRERALQRALCLSGGSGAAAAERPPRIGLSARETRFKRLEPPVERPGLVERQVAPLERVLPAIRDRVAAERPSEGDDLLRAREQERRRHRSVGSSG